jgi:hypothetical protein
MMEARFDTGGELWRHAGCNQRRIDHDSSAADDARNDSPDDAGSGEKGGGEDADRKVIRKEGMSAPRPCLIVMLGLDPGIHDGSLSRKAAMSALVAPRHGLPGQSRQ